MAWRDQLQPASFRGVPFEVTASSLTAGRRLARHEYPQRDVPYLEDMGRRAREYKVEAFIIGPEYMAERDRLLAAIEEQGAGQLVHRYYGTKLVTVAECELSESTEFGGLAKFTLLFVEAGELAQPTVGVDSAAELAAVQDVAYDGIAEDFQQQFSVEGLPSWGVGDVQTSVTDTLRLDELRRSSASANSFATRLGNLISFPGALAVEIVGLVRSLSSVSNILKKPYAPTGTGSGTVQNASARGVVQRQQAVATALIKRAALVRHAGLAANAELSTSDDVKAVRADLLRLFDEHDYAVGAPRPSADVAMALKSVRTAALLHLSRQSAALPQMQSMQLPETQPALALSYALYGELRGGEIVRRNGVRHPGFVPAGVPLQLAAQ
jgi:prophage DNA circulation protein